MVKFEERLDLNVPGFASYSSSEEEKSEPFCLRRVPVVIRNYCNVNAPKA